MSRSTQFQTFLRCCAIAAMSVAISQQAQAQGAGGYGSESEMGSYGGPNAAMGKPPTAAEERRFQRGIRRVIKSLQQAETEEEKQRLLELGRKGLQWRYQSKLDQRKRKLEELRQQLAQLEADYQRREDAMPRVIDLQLESLKLAAEGVIEVDNILGSTSSRGAGGMEMDMMGGPMMGEDMMMKEEMMGMGPEMGMGMEARDPLPPADQPIEPDEDPFEGLDGEQK